MSRFSPLKFQFYPVILVVLATYSYAYQLPGDPPPKDGRLAVDSLHLSVDDTKVESSVAYQGEDAATLMHRLEDANGLSIISSYSSKMGDPLESTNNLNRDGFWDMSLSTPRAGALPAVEIDFSSGGFDGENGAEFSSQEHRMLGIKTSGKLGSLRHGIKYRAVGADYEVVDKKKKLKDKDRDNEIIESWVGTTFGDLFVRQFVTQSERNRNNPDKPLTRESLTGTSISYTWSHWPYVSTSFSQATGTRENIEKELGETDFQVGISSIEGSFSVSSNKWSADLYVDKTAPDGNGGQWFGEPDSISYYFGGSIYPNKTLTITPSISFTEDAYRDYGVETQSISTSLSLYYKPARKRYSFSAYASTDSEENQAWGMDSTAFYSEASVYWRLGDPGQRSANKILSLSFGYDRYEDHIYARSSSDDMSVTIEFRSYSLGGIFGSFNRARYDRLSPYYEAQ